MKVPINKDSPLAMDDFDAAVQQRMERLQSYIDLIRTAEAVEEEVKVKGTKLYLGPEDVAAYLNCSIPTARQYMHRPGFPLIQLGENGTKSVSYTHLTLPTISLVCRSRWSPYH